MLSSNFFTVISPSVLTTWPSHSSLPDLSAITKSGDLNLLLISYSHFYSPITIPIYFSRNFPVPLFAFYLLGSKIRHGRSQFVLFVYIDLLLMGMLYVCMTFLAYWIHLNIIIPSVTARLITLIHFKLTRLYLAAHTSIVSCFSSLSHFHIHTHTHTRTDIHSLLQFLWISLTEMFIKSFSHFFVVVTNSCVYGRLWCIIWRWLLAEKAEVSSCEDSLPSVCKLFFCTNLYLQ